MIPSEEFVSLACKLSSQQLTSVLINAFELIPYKNEERGAGNEHEEQENENWEQNLIWTLALSVTSFSMICFVSLFSNSKYKPRNGVTCFLFV